jgi:hypothetical protein
MTVIPGPVVTPLKGQKLMYGGNRDRIAGTDPELSTTWGTVGCIGDPSATFPHHCGSGDFTRVNESGKIEVALLE